MIEIIVLWRLSRIIGDIVRAKGRRAWPWVLLTVLLWFGGELTGAVIGAAIWQTAGEASHVLVYVAALAGAAAGYAVVHGIAITLAPATPAPAPEPREVMQEVAGGRVESAAVVKPLAGISRWLDGLLEANVGLAVLAVLLSIYNWAEYANVGPRADTDPALPSEMVVMLHGLVAVPLGLVTAFTFLRWVYRGNRNLQILTGKLSYTPMMAIASYFIPIACLWMPYLTMREIWVVAHDGERTGGRVLDWWWFVWLVSTCLIHSGAMTYTMVAFGTGNLKVAALGNGIESLFDIVLGLVTLSLVSSIATAYGQNYPEPNARRVPIEPGPGADVTGAGAVSA